MFFIQAKVFQLVHGIDANLKQYENFESSRGLINEYSKRWLVMVQHKMFVI